MRKIFFLFMCIGFVATMSAQTKGFDEKSKFGISANLAYDYEYGNCKAGVAQFYFNKVLLDVAISDLGRYPNIGLALGYKFNILPKLNVYPLLGAYQAGRHEVKIEFNFGGGLQYPISRNLFLNARVTAKEVAGGLGIYL